MLQSYTPTTSYKHAKLVPTTIFSNSKTSILEPKVEMSLHALRIFKEVTRGFPRLQIFLEHNNKKIRWSHAHFDELSPLGRLIWLRIPTVVYWSLWKERNQRDFQDVVTAPHMTPNLDFSLLYSWLSHLPAVSNVKFHEWLFNWRFVASSWGSLALFRDVFLMRSC